MIRCFRTLHLWTSVIICLVFVKTSLVCSDNTLGMSFDAIPAHHRKAGSRKFYLLADFPNRVSQFIMLNTSIINIKFETYWKNSRIHTVQVHAFSLFLSDTVTQFCHNAWWLLRWLHACCMNVMEGPYSIATRAHYRVGEASNGDPEIWSGKIT